MSEIEEILMYGDGYGNIYTTREKAKASADEIAVMKKREERGEEIMSVLRPLYEHYDMRAGRRSRHKHFFDEVIRYLAKNSYTVVKKEYE